MLASEIFAPSMTLAEKQAFVTVLFAISETIRARREIPSGELYALVCGRTDLDGYQRMLGILKRNELVSETAHVLRWIGPRIPA